MKVGPSHDFPIVEVDKKHFKVVVKNQEGNFDDFITFDSDWGPLSSGVFSSFSLIMTDEISRALESGHDPFWVKDNS